MDVNLLISSSAKLAQSINGYLADVRAAKHPFQLGAVLNIVREIATATMSRKEAAAPSWNDVSQSIAQLMHDGGVLLPLALEADNVVKSNLTPRLLSCQVFIFPISYGYRPLGSSCSGYQVQSCRER